jgi:hypothetical protein
MTTHLNLGQQQRKSIPLVPSGAGAHALHFCCSVLQAVGLVQKLGPNGCDLNRIIRSRR